MSHFHDTSRAVLAAPLPGPNRKRTETFYLYRVVYRNPQPESPGCVLLWHVSGGREPYQVALEREQLGGLSWHCTCADHVYRHELMDRHVCKHVRALQEFSAVPTSGKAA